MKLNLEEISIADVPITKIEVDAVLCIMTVYCDRIFRVRDNKWLGKTRITIRDWTKFFLEKYVSYVPFAEGQTFQIDWTKQIETFEFIQEINCADNVLFLKGFSKESGVWLTYQFSNYT